VGRSGRSRSAEAKRTGRGRASRLPWWLVALFGAGPCVADAQSTGRFSADEVERGRLQFERTCAQCHGRNMVNPGTTSYDLRRFPTDDADRFITSVTDGKGNMPSFRDALTGEQIRLLWAYVGSRGGKER
jgi:mono/diheme cytochrome c family protein